MRKGTVQLVAAVFTVAVFNVVLYSQQKPVTAGSLVPEDPPAYGRTWEEKQEKVTVLPQNVDVPVATIGEFLDREKSRYCMAEAIYFEAGNQPLAGKLAVAYVVLNRVADKRFPNNICDVVHEGVRGANGGMLRNKCQFSYYCDGKHDKPKQESKHWRESIFAAEFSESNAYDITEGSTHYHATYVHPGWSKVLTRVVRIQDHIFYK